jgi:hypothetical protein
MNAIRSILIIGSVFLGFHFDAQSQSIRQIEKKMQSANWSGAKSLLQKAMLRDSSNIELNWLLTEWYYNKANPSHQIDSANRYFGQTVKFYNLLNSKSKERLNRQGIDESVFQNVKTKIDSLAFDLAKQLNTINSYNHFITNYANAPQQASAIELRDEVAFLDALKQNTYQSFFNYIQNYPRSHRLSDARARYEKLLYESKTKDGTLLSYAIFINQFPQSPYRSEAERHVFELSTVAGDSTAFLHYLREYPQGKFRKRASDIAYYHFIDEDINPSAMLLTDSLLAVRKLNESYWVPFWAKGKYGFMDAAGRETLAPSFADVATEYKCEMVEADVLVTSAGLVARNGKKIFDSDKVMQPLGLGFWKVGDSSCVRVVHSAGHKLNNHCFNHARLVGNRYFWIKDKATSGIYSLTGRLLAKGEWDFVDWMEGTLVVTQLQKKTIITSKNIQQLAEGKPFTAAHVYDDVKIVGKNRLLVRNGALEGIIDSDGQFLVPLGRQVLSLEGFGLVRKVGDDFFFDNVDVQFAGRKIKLYKQYRGWLQVVTPTSVELWDIRTRKFLQRPDSSWFAAGLLFSKTGDSTKVYFNSGRTISFTNDQKIALIPSRDSIHAFVTNEGKQKRNVYSVRDGTKLFAAEFEAIESIDANLFLLTRKGKRGILSRDGKWIVAMEYDLLVPNLPPLWSTFKDKKFGLVNISTGATFKTFSTRNIVILHADLFGVFEKGKYGLVNAKGKPVTKFEFEELLRWSKQLVWVKKNFAWSLLDIATNKPIVSNVTRFDKWIDQENNKLYRIQKDNFFGVVSSQLGVVIPPGFSMVKNVGSLEQPLYLTDKEVEEAEVHVVIYYDSAGKFIRKQVYEDEEFETLMCQENEK